MSVVLGSATLRNFRESVLRSAAGPADADDDDDDDTKELDVGLDINQAATNEQAYFTRKVLAVSWLLQLKIYLKVAKALAVHVCTSPAQRSTHNCHAPTRHRTEEVQLGQCARQGLHWLHC